LKLICIGDSLTYGYGLKRSDVWVSLLENEYGIQVINKGINGDSTTGMLARFHQDVIENGASHVMIMGGSNDFMMRVPLSIVCSNIATMVHQSRNHLIVPIIGIQPPTEPEMARKCWSDMVDYSEVNRDLMRYREWALRFSELFNVAVIDFYADFQRYLAQENPHEIYTDGLHLTPKGNGLMLDTIGRWVEANKK